MKKHSILLSICMLFCVFLVGCPAEPTTTTTLDPRWKQCKAVPGTLEPMPSEINVLIKARNSAQVNAKENEVIFFYWRDDGQYDDWALWFWSTGGDGENNWDAIMNHGFSEVKIDGHNIGYMKFNSEGTSENDCIPLVASDAKTIAEKGTFNLIVRKKDGWTKDYNGDLKWELMEGNYFGQLSGKPDIYSITKGAKPQIMNAIMQTKNSIAIGLSQKLAITPYPGVNNFSVYSASGKTAEISDVVFLGLANDKRLDPNYEKYTSAQDLKLRSSKNYEKEYVIKTKEDLDLSDTWYVKHPKFIPIDGLQLSPSTALKSDIQTLEYTGDDLGLTLNGTTATFKVFAPIASEANVLLYNSWEDAKVDVEASNKVNSTATTNDTLTNNGKRVPMKASNGDGVWCAADIDVSGYNYYVYELNNLNVIYRVCDINAKVCSPDSIAAQIIDIDDNDCQPSNWESSYTNPFGNSGIDTKSYTDAVIFEMHIRDWSKVVNSDSTGKFDDITTALGTNGNGTLGAHLKDLGVTHVQILPMFDYAQKNSDNEYNWGYNPYHYNVPEGRYVNNHDNGGNEAVRQMRNMIKAFHDAGIAVNMDVVYNHTNGTGFGSLYDMTVPYYYYRLANGMYSNGSGCGNETDSSMPMYKKYMIDSLSHWMTDYHINGFRFDLMGLHEAETMAAIYTALSQIDKNVMVYGEPWTGGTSPVKNSAEKAGKVGNAGYGAFDDGLRNAVKGGEFNGFEKGQVQGTFNDVAIIDGLKGTSSRNDTGVPGLAIHYVECHDNYTLFDKLDISIVDGTSKEDWIPYDSLTSAQQDSIRAQNKLCAAFIFLAQGTPFINGGQEFMRTKQGDENSYISSDDVNGIDISMKEKFSDVYNVYKGLIALRHSTDAFTAGKNVKATKVKEGLTKYVTTGTDATYTVFFNATTSEQSTEIDATSDVIDVTNGKLDVANLVPSSVPACSFLIIKQ